MHCFIGFTDLSYILEHQACSSDNGSLSLFFEYKDTNKEMIMQVSLPSSAGEKTTLVLQVLNTQNEGQKNESSHVMRHRFEEKLY